MPPSLNTQQFVLPDDQWIHRSAPSDINREIDAYPKHIASESMGETSAPYDAASLAEIYHPRVRQLMDMQSRGATHAAWGRTATDDQNRWHPVNADTPEIKSRATGTPGQAKKTVAKIRGAALS